MRAFLLTDSMVENPHINIGNIQIELTSDDPNEEGADGGGDRDGDGRTRSMRFSNSPVLSSEHG